MVSSAEAASEASHSGGGTAGPEHGHAHGVHDLPLRKAIGERLIELRTMSKETKVYVGLSMFVLLVLAVLALIRNDHIGPLVTSDYFSEDGNSAASMTQMLFDASIVFTAFGWAMVVTAAARAGWIVRLAALAALGLWFVPERDSVTQINTFTTVMAAILVGLVGALVVFTWFPERHVRDHKDPLVVKGGDGWKKLRRLVPVAAFALFIGLYVLVWQGWSSGGYGNGYFPSFVGDQLSNIQWLLVPIIVLAGADFGDWGNFASGRVIARVRRITPNAVYYGIAVVATAAIVFDGLRISRGDGAGIEPELIIGAIIAAVTVIVLLIAEPRGSWGGHFPYLVLVGASAIDGFTSWVISTMVSNDPNGWKTDGWDALVWLGLAAVGLALIALGRRRLPTWLVVSAVYACLLGVVYLFTDLDSVSSIVHPFGWNADTAPWIGFEGLKAVAGIVTLAVIVLAAVRRKLVDWERPIALLLSMTVAFQVLAWIASLYGGAVSHSGAAKVTGQLALFAAVVLVLALSWEFASSGEGITNGHRLRFPRDSRVLAFLGYVVVTAVVSVFWSSIGTLDGGHWELLESQFEAETYVQTGLLFLGSPLVVAIFVIGFNRWRQERAEARAQTAPVVPVEPEAVAVDR